MTKACVSPCTPQWGVNDTDYLKIMDGRFVQRTHGTETGWIQSKYDDWCIPWIILIHELLAARQESEQGYIITEQKESITLPRSLIRGIAPQKSNED
jgi:hypothetical protein